MRADGAGLVAAAASLGPGPARFVLGGAEPGRGWPVRAELLCGMLAADSGGNASGKDARRGGMPPGTDRAGPHQFRAIGSALRPDGPRCRLRAATVQPSFPHRSATTFQNAKARDTEPKLKIRLWSSNSFVRQTWV